MTSLEARRIYGCRVLEHVDDAVRVLVSLELAFDDQSCLTLGCAADGRSLRAEPQPMAWSQVPERGHIEIHSSHEACEILRPGATLTEERLLVDLGQHTIGVALATRHDALYVFNWCGALRCARDMPRELSAVLEAQPLTYRSRAVTVARRPAERGTMDPKERLRRKLTWRVKERATTDLAADSPAPPAEGGGRVVFEDEHGRPRRLPANLGELSPDQRDAAIAAMSQALGGAPPDAAKLAAIERLTELRAAGKLTEEQFQKERRRLEDY